MKVLLSIKPEFVEKILSGDKKFEFRKSCFKNNDITHVVMYSTMPVGKVVGEFEIETILLDTPKAIWSRTKQHSGITKRFFDQYYVGREKAVAIMIKNVKEYENPLLLSDVGANIKAPQSFLYLHN